MVILSVFAFLAGVITILSPCIIPVLPVILAGGLGGKKNKPIGIVLGFILSFTLFTLALTTIVQAFGISPDALRIFAVIVIVLFGLVLLIPPLQRRFEIVAAKMANTGIGKGKAPSSEKTGLRGLLSGLPVGISLGLVWTPCVGPIMASVISLALTKRVDSGAVLITLSYSLGTALPMFLVMYTGRKLLNRTSFLVRNIGTIQKGFGILMIVVGISIGMNWDRQFQAALLRVFPEYGSGLTAIENIPLIRKALDERNTRGDEDGAMTGNGGIANTRLLVYDQQPKKGALQDYGLAPEIVTDGEWLNSGPLSMEDLRGKVVLVDFWTYSCINCIRTLPYLQSWYEKYKDQGLVIIGVHTPEFEFEKDTGNLRKAMDDLGVTCPVVQDNAYTQWRAYSNRYWPAHYFIDAQGHLRYYGFGEGHYEDAEKVIRKLLQEAGREIGAESSLVKRDIEAKTPETYLGFGREDGFVSETPPVRNQGEMYVPSEDLKNGDWTLEGMWTMEKDYILGEDKGRLDLNFHAKKVYLVVEPEEPGAAMTVLLDGEPVERTKDIRQGVLVPEESRLYELVDLPESGPHVLSLEVQGRLRLFAFTFG